MLPDTKLGQLQSNVNVESQRNFSTWLSTFAIRPGYFAVPLNVFTRVEVPCRKPHEDFRSMHCSHRRAVEEVGLLEVDM